MSAQATEKDVEHKGWYELLVNAMQQEQRDDGKLGAAMQLATVDMKSNHPRVRTLFHRGFITASAYPNLPLILTTTDDSVSEITQLDFDDQPFHEVVYWFPSTLEQFRILGRVSMVPEPGDYEYPMEGIVHAELEKEGFNWEAKRVETFDQMSDVLKAEFCPPKGKAGNKKDKKNLATAPFNFALLLIEPFQVEYRKLGVLPGRWWFRHRWEDGDETEFQAYGQDD